MRFSSFLDFASSSDVLAAVSDYLKCVPTLSTTLPKGIRFVESNAAFDETPETPHDSQLYHLDYYRVPNVYVLVLLTDTEAKTQGPWTFLPKSVSEEAARKLRCWKRGVLYHFTDEQVYAVAPREQAIEFAYPRGTVLFIESSGCLHYGSRNCVKPRYQLMYGYTGACRTDLSEYFVKPLEYPVREEDSRIRKLLLDRHRLT